MQITLKNVGCIAEATVELTGLNVIAGPNGTGKSTVDRTVYTVIKSISDCDAIVYENRKDLVLNLCKAVFFSIQYNLGHRAAAANNGDVKILMDNFNQSFANDLVMFLRNKEYEKAKKLIEHNACILDSFAGLDSKSKPSVKKYLDELMDVFTQINQNDAIKQSLEFMYMEMFNQQVNNLKNHKTSEVSIDNNGERFEYSVSNNAKALPFSNRLKVGDISESFKQGMFTNAAFVETTLVLQVSDTQNLPFHWKDFVDKLKSETRAEYSFCKKIYDELSEILGGELVYLTDKQDFYFVPKGADNKLYISNMAAGEKMFGILQKMAKMGLLSPDRLLILDEPGSHLHPQWQVKLAEILITLVKNNISILLTTHSAVLINALQDFAELENVSDKTKFYFADKKDGTIKNVELIENEKDVIFESFYAAKKFLPDFISK